MNPKSTYQPANWQLPEGVSAGNWDYIRSSQIGGKYEQFLKNDPLATADGAFLARKLPGVTAGGNDRPVVVDYGCGNGRTLMPIVGRGYRGVGIDLSPAMLHACQPSTHPDPLQNGPALIQANLVQLDFLEENWADYGLCMFSTLGMIQSQGCRKAFLQHVRRHLKPEGRFFVHAHRLWFQLKHPGGWKWLVGNAWAAFRGQVEFGDRTANYRGVRNVMIHSFRHRELKSLLEASGLIPTEWYSIEPQSEQFRPSDQVPSRNTVGWLVECRVDNRKE